MSTYIRPNSATFWTGVGLVGYAVYQFVSGEADASRTLMEGLGLIFLRRAVAMNGLDK